MNKKERLEQLGIYAVKDETCSDIEFKQIKDNKIITTLNTYMFDENVSLELMNAIES